MCKAKDCKLKNYQFSTKEEKLIPDLGENKFVSKVIYFAILENGKFIKNNHDFFECYGKTEQDAKSKMRKVVENWVSENIAKLG